MSATLIEPKVRTVLTVRLEHDSDTECPIGESGDVKEKIVSFGRNHVNHDDYEKYFEYTSEGWAPKIGLRRQLATGTAFLLSYYEHGLCKWSLSGEGPQCRWDSVGMAGIYWLPSDVPKDRRETYARGAMEEYTNWCNGNCYGYMIEATTYTTIEKDGKEYTNEETEDVDSCWGFIGSDYFMERVVEEINGYLASHKVDEIKLRGEAKDVASYTDMPKANAA
jgi:hypothetical protein